MYTTHVVARATRDCSQIDHGSSAHTCPGPIVWKITDLGVRVRGKTERAKILPIEQLDLGGEVWDLLLCPKIREKWLRGALIRTKPRREVGGARCELVRQAE